MNKLTKWLAAVLAVVLVIYAGLSLHEGYPLGTGSSRAHRHAQQYCDVAYPGAELGKTEYNRAMATYQTPVTAEGETFTIFTSARWDDVIDRTRFETVADELGMDELFAELNEKHFPGREDSWAYCSMLWSCETPETPRVFLDVYYQAAEDEDILNDVQMKDFLFPIVEDCRNALEAVVPVESVQASYYHPLYKKHMAGDDGQMWRRVSLDVGEGAALTIQRFQNAETTERIYTLSE